MILALDASVVVKWFAANGERNAAQADAVRLAWQSGSVSVVAPALLSLEVLNVAARKWKFGAAQLDVVAETIEDLGFELLAPVLTDVARWAAVGLSAYDAAYVAVAEAERVHLITDDAEIVRLAPSVAIPLADVEALLAS